jgi:hypothetical protein
MQSRNFLPLEIRIRFETREFHLFQVNRHNEVVLWRRRRRRRRRRISYQVSCQL